MNFVTHILLLFSLVSCTLSLNISGSVRELSTVYDIYTVDPKLDITWADNVKLWYVPLWNKVDLYLVSTLFNGEEEANKMKEVDTNKICAYVTPNGTDTWHGYGDKEIVFKGYSTPLRPGRFDYTILNPDGSDRGFVVETREVFTDNKTYFTEVCLWKNGLLGFVVYSTQPKLNPKDEKEIRMKMKSLGFKEENIVSYSYKKNCPKMKEEEIKWRLPSP